MPFIGMDSTERGEPSRFEDAQKNPRAVFTGAPYTVAPTVTPFTTFPQAEQDVVFDLVDLTRRAVAISDFSGGQQGRNFTKYGFSVDSGQTWSEQYVPVNSPGGLLVTRDNKLWDANSDPVLATHHSGLVYLANLYINGLSNSFDMSNGIYVSRTTWDDRLFTKENTFPAVVNASPTTPFFGDKEWIAVDNSLGANDGNVYISFTRFAGADNRIRFVRSRDQGATWSAPLALSPLSQNGTVQGTQVAVGPTGTVYVAYSRTLQGAQRQIWLLRSLDGGVTWRAPHQITPTFTTLSNFPSKYRVNSFPAMAVSAVDGSLHVVYADQPDFTTGGTVNYIKSIDGGVNWTAPLVINDVDTGQQFMPSVAVDDGNIVHAAWFDTRNAISVLGVPLARTFDVYASYSRATGVFSPNARVTAQSQDSGAGNGFIGDYMGIRARGGIAKPVWNSGGFNNGKLQTTTLVVPL
jgi:hypothetical protein